MAPGREAGRRDAESQGQAAGAEGPRCARQPRMPDPFLDPQSAMPAGAALAHSGGGLDRGRRGHRAGRFIDLVPWKRHPDSLGPRPGRLGQVRQQGRGPCRGLTCGVRHPGWPRVSSSALCSSALPLQKPPSPSRSLPGGSGAWGGHVTPTCDPGSPAHPSCGSSARRLSTVTMHRLGRCFTSPARGLGACPKHGDDTFGLTLAFPY